MNAVQLAAGSLVFTAVLVLLGESIVIVHRGSGVTNFAAASVGVVGTYFFYDLWPGHGLPWPIALSIGLAASAAIGAGFHIVVMRRLRRSSVATRVIATLGLMLLVESMSDQYFAPGGAIRSVASFLPTGQLHPFTTLSINMDGPILIGIAGAITILLLVLQRATRFGLATTAVCENETVAAGMGWSPNFIAAANWALGSALGALAFILLAPVSGLSPDFLTLLVVPALVGQFDSILLTLVGALAIGIGEAEVGLVTTAPGWAEATPLIVIVGILLIRKPARYNRSDAAQRLARVGTGVMRWAAAVAAAAGILLMFFVSVDWISPVTTTLIFAISMLSVVVLTAYAGQLSLAQFGLAGMSAFLMAIISAQWGWPLWASMLVAVVLTVPLGLVVAIPAFRTTGAALAIATLSLLVVIQDLVLANPSTAGWLKSGGLPPLEIFGYRFDIIGHPRRYAVFVMVVLILVCVAVANLRRSAMGRRLLAIRTNPQAAAALGVNPSSMKLYGFVVAAVITAICGVLLEAELSFAEFGTFSTFASISSVLQTTIGGIGMIAGGVFAGTWVPGGIGNKILAIILTPSNIPGNWLTVLTGAGVLYIIVAAPNGIMWLVKTRIDAQRAWVRRHVGRSVRAPREDAWARAIRSVSTTGAAVPRHHPIRIEVDDLVVAFGGLRAVDGVSLSVNPGEIVGLIGPNGAGKTALIDAVSGAQRMTSGRVRLDGKVIDGLTAAERARHGLARSFQSLELFEDMTVGENLLAASESPNRLQAFTDLIWPRGPRPTPAAVRAVHDFGLAKVVGQTPRHLDHGRRRLVAIARAFAGDAGVILLDEPAAGLDPRERSELGETLRRVAGERNVGVLLVEHDVDLVFRVSDRVVGIVFGRIVAEGSPEVVRRSPALVSAYLGSPADQLDTLSGNRVESRPQP